jgi:aryl-alcohol dehydrogenase-like predicted oxidoreductase
MNHGFDSRKLGLGTVQFGQAYGVSNTQGQVPEAEVRTILAHAAQAGVGVLDTAAGYGEAENVLGALAAETKPFRIVTKTISIRNGIDAVVARARQSAQTLKRMPVDLLMVHAAGELAGSDGEKLWNALLALRDEGLFNGIGISAYVADDPAALAARFRPAAMQVPFSVLDQRLLANGALTRLQELGVEVHARSLFLQGLLFVPSEKLPPKLTHIGPKLDTVRAMLGARPLDAALAFVLQRPEIDVAVVGVTRAAELDEIVAAAAKPAPAVDWKTCALDDEVVLTPSLW